MATRYATAADVKAYYGTIRFDQLTTDSGTDADDSLIIAACDAQSRLIDGYLMGRYGCPIIGPSAVLDVLKTHCIRLVMYSLFQGRLLAEQYQGITDDRDITIKWLQDIAANRSSIPGQTIPGVAALSGAMAGGSQRQVFGDGQILGNFGNIDY